jgi:N4-gp56 family major capsid protein
MAVSTATTWSAVVHAAYEKDYLSCFLANSSWMKLVNWRGTTGANKGSTISFPINTRLARATSTLTDGADVQATYAVPTEVAVTIAEYGNAVQISHLLDATTYTDAHKMVAEQVAENAVNSLDYYVRGAALANTVVVYPSGCTARTDLDATNDLPTYDEVVQAVQRAASLEIEPFDDGTYVTMVHPIGVAMLRKLTEITAIAQQSDPQLMYTGKSALKGNERFPGEVFKINNLRVVQHPWGKVYLGAGTTAQSATTCDGAVAAGDTSFDVANASGIVAGDWITVGTLESGTTQQATTEQVLVTAVDSNAITIQGAGASFGFKFAHDSGAAVTEAANVFAMPIFGKNSIVGYFDESIGREGQLANREHYTVVPNRLWNYSWYWVGGVAKVDSKIVRAEFATTMGLHGTP